MREGILVHLFSQLGKFAFSVVLSITCFACASIRPIVPHDQTPLERKFVKNYTVGRKQTAYVGDPVVKIVDFYVRNVSVDRVKASNDFVVSGGPLLYLENVAGKKGDTFKILGLVKYFGVEYYAVNFGGNPVLRHFVGKDGRFSGKASEHSGIMRNPPYFRVDPPTTLFRRYSEEEVVTNRGYINYELVYTGRGDDGMKLLYREFTPDDLARPAFYQELTYSSDAKVIRFRKLRISVESADNEVIVYRVLDDGL
ncbi:MAG: hypothetical protein KAX20_06125 [Candidatus Omnitrophica bacterium]|nr:hypothetical protein [Candidatus Omnitrophota bacterium]